MLSPLRIACRSLARTPGFTAVAILTLALCLGANFALYSVVGAVLLRGLPFPEADRLVTLINSYPGAGSERSSASIANYFDRRTALPAVASLSIFQENSTTVGDNGSPQRLPILRISPEFFATLGVALVRGRAFTDDELTYQNDRVAIITDHFWRTHFNADPAVIGRTFLNDGLPVTVVGLLPADFRFLSSRAEFFRPDSHDPKVRSPEHRHSNNQTMIARLAPGATVAVVQAQLEALNAKLLLDDPYARLVRDTGYRTNVYELHRDHVRTIRPTLLLLQAGGLCLLGIGVFNLANLLLVRASGRQRDLAVRQALGAGGRHVAVDVVAETLLLTLAGGLLGALLGSFGVDLIRTFAADLLPLGATISFGGRTALLGLAASLVVGLAIAAPIVWFSLHTRLAATLQSCSRGGTTSHAVHRLRHAFIVVQITLAFGLTTGAGLLRASLARALDTPTGFQPAQLLAGNISLPWVDYRGTANQLAFSERLLPALRQLPGVGSVALSTSLPFAQIDNDSVVTVEGCRTAPGESMLSHYICSVSAGYWGTLQIPLLRGRLLTEADSLSTAQVCVVDQAFAERYWPGQDPIGRRLAQGASITVENAITVVGVVGAVKQQDLTEKDGHGAIYLPWKGRGNFSVILRTTLPPAALAPAVRKAVEQLDPGLPVDDLRPMHQRIDDTLLARRSPTVLAALFGGVALLLSGLGTYGVLGYVVSQRQQEIGIRSALGARPEVIGRQFLAMGLRLLAAGLLFGLLAAWAVGASLRSLLFGVPTLHLPTLAVAAFTLLVTVLIACWLPARRAARVDPMTALRSE